MSDLISRQDAIKTVIRMCSPICDWELEKKAYTDCVIDEINSLPSATCDDCIWHVCNYNKIDWDGEDGYISRQDAVSEIDEWIQMATGNGTDMAIKDFLSFLKERIESLPSAEPKTGEWIDYVGKDLGIEGQWLRDDGKTVFVQCDQCDSMFVRNLMTHMNYCPNCGAKMKGADDED